MVLPPLQPPPSPGAGAAATAARVSRRHSHLPSPGAGAATAGSPGVPRRRARRCCHLSAEMGNRRKSGQGHLGLEFWVFLFPFLFFFHLFFSRRLVHCLPAQVEIETAVAAAAAAVAAFINKTDVSSAIIAMIMSLIEIGLLCAHSMAYCILD